MHAGGLQLLFEVGARDHRRSELSPGAERAPVMARQLQRFQAVSDHWEGVAGPRIPRVRA